MKVTRRSVLFLTDSLSVRSRSLPQTKTVPLWEFIDSPSSRGPHCCVVIQTDSNHYLGLAYYAALIAEARGYLVFPTADAMFRAGPPLVNAEGIDAVCSRFKRQISSTRPNVSGSPAATIDHKASSKFFQLLVLLKANDKFPPSDRASLSRLVKIGRGAGVSVRIRSNADYEDVEQADGIFLRCSNSYLYSIAAETLGIPVIDDLHSVLRCNNKAFIAELLRTGKLPHPKTVLLATGSPIRSAKIAEEALGIPLVIKHPSRSHGQGVFKANSRDSLERRLKQLSCDTPLALAQEFLPSPFDWRIGVLDNVPLFACRYYMVPGYWKIIRYSSRSRSGEGKVEQIDLKHVPNEIIRLAVRATKLIGRGLYGVDLKETTRGVIIVEINDNPDLNNGYELATAETEVWQRVINWFLSREHSLGSDCQQNR